MDVLKPSFAVLKQYEKDRGRNLKLLLADVLDRDKSESHQGITRTVSGVIRRQRLLDYFIQQFSNRGPKKLERDVLILLRIGLYLLIYSRSYPAHAVVNETVGLVKSKAKGFVNAVLRRCTRDKEKIPGMMAAVTDLSVKHSISPLLIEHLKHISADLNASLDYLDREPVFHIRVNSKDFSYAGVKEVLGRGEIGFNELNSFHAFSVDGAHGSGLQLRRLLQEKKYFYFQNTASQLVSIIAAQFSRQTVLDCCAAPGSKSVTLSLLKPRLTVYANDINAKRIMLVKDFRTAYGLDNIKPVVSDVNQLGLRGPFDFIILDAPCTSAGTLRKNPDLKLKITPGLVRKNADGQARMLETLITRFPGAHILYSVCSFIRDETEDVLSRVIPRHPGAETADLSPILEEYGFNYKKGRYGFYLLPHPELNNDLFYLSLVKGVER
ncbi:MAG: hypothetical protein GY950_27735 [bacterium]|nr:hypothetical protein [bacterium]